MASENRLLNTVYEFEGITNYPLQDYLNRFANFQSTHYPEIVSYFSGISDISRKSFDELIYLKKEIAKILDIIDNQGWMGTMLHWDLVDKVDQIDTFLKTASNASKWMRVTVTNSRPNSATDVDTSLSNNSQLEDIERLDLGSANPQDTWTDTAIRNDLSEEDIAQGTLLTVTLTGAINTFDINSVVDNPSGKNIYGRDIDKSFVFENDDLKYLEYDETMDQSVEILLGLTKGKNFFEPQDGISKGEAIGTTRAAISYPAIFRQLSESLRTDDSIATFSIVDIVRDQDALFFDVQITTRLGEFIKNKVEI